MSAGRPTTEVERMIMQSSVEDGYETFISRVATGRGMSIEAVKEVASGRVWTGNQAKARGLVDVLGGLDTAIEIAAGKIKAGDDYRVVYYPEVKPWFETIMDDFGQNVRVGFLKHELQENYKIYQQVEKLKSYQGIQARMAQEISIK
jgi:protease-4